MTWKDRGVNAATKDLEKSLQTKCSTLLEKTSHVTWDLNLLFKLKRHITRIFMDKVQEVWFFWGGLNILIWEISPGLLYVFVAQGRSKCHY